jgi:hypothetical protein
MDTKLNGTEQHILQLLHALLHVHVQVVPYKEMKEGMTVKRKQPWVRRALSIKAYDLTDDRTGDSALWRQCPRI